MTADVNIQGTPDAQQKLARLMERLQSELGHSAPETVRWAAWYVAKSLGASMRVAPKARRFVPNSGNDKRHSKEHWAGYVWTYNRTGQKVQKWVRIGEDVSRYTMIRRRGLARQTWLWAIADMGKGVTPTQLRRPAGVMTTTTAGGANPSLTMANKLSYVLSAARTTGRIAIDTAVSRGATAGLRYLDRRLAKANR